MGKAFQDRTRQLTDLIILTAGFMAIGMEKAFVCAEDVADDQVMRNRAQRIAIQESPVHHIDHLVYGTTAIYGQQQIENKLGIAVYHLTTEYDLTEIQQSKIKLAAKLEAKHFFFEVEQLRRTYDRVSGDPNSNRAVGDQVQTLRQQFKTMFGPQSFLSKVVAKTVTGEQLVKFQAVISERLRLRHRSNIEGAIRDIERQVVLRISQHEALVDLLTQELMPPTAANDFDEALVKYQFSQLDEKALKALFDDGQWPSVRKVFDGFTKFQLVLAKQGFLAGQAVDSSPTLSEKVRQQETAAAIH